MTIFIDFSTSYGEVSKKNFFMKIVKQSYVFNRKSALPVQASPFLGGLRLLALLWVFTRQLFFILLALLGLDLFQVYLGTTRGPLTALPSRSSKYT